MTLKNVLKFLGLVCTLMVLTTVTAMNVEELVHKAQEDLTHISDYMRLMN